MYPFLKSFALALLAPPSGPLLVIVAGLVLASWQPKAGRVVALLGVICLWLASTPLVVLMLTMQLGSEHAVNLAEANRAQAIVILGAGLRRNAPEFGGDALGPLTLERVYYGATLARETGLPVLVSGGIPIGATRSEAGLMKQSLESGFGTAVRWIEDKSEDTHQNAVKSAAMLHKDGVDRILLVTHAFDAPRARDRFEQAGMAVISAPTGVPAITEWEPELLLPSPHAMTDGYYLAYEVLARFADRWLPGR